MAIRVVVADDHAIVLASISRWLEASGEVEVVATAGDGLIAVQAVERTRPDVVLMDLSMPRLDGAAATRRILAANPGARVVILTSFAGRERVLDALDAGAIGYLLKDGEPEEVLRGVIAAASGEAPLAPRVARVVLDARRTPAPGLSEREREVLSEVATGRSNKEIAWRLGITEKTVKTHLTRIFERLGVADRTQAAVWAVRNGVATGAD
ncbi:MAG: DNA-binding response regulator [Chloroflexi bacterium RBG_16_72_14]|nr:MAG: DNA-binding response regulator [Chloroflexi bacterium RBG_16_72_14]